MAKGYLLYEECGTEGDYDYYREDVAFYLDRQKAEEEKERLNEELSRNPRAYNYNYEIEEVEIIG